MKITSSELFNKIWEAASLAGHLDDIKPIIDYVSDRKVNAFELNPDGAYVECVLNTDGNEGIWIDFYVNNDDVAHKYFGCIKTLSENVDACKLMGAAAGALQFVARNVIWNLYKTSME